LLHWTFRRSLRSALRRSLCGTTIRRWRTRKIYGGKKEMIISY
jgi:hypothetical protein